MQGLGKIFLVLMALLPLGSALGIPLPKQEQVVRKAGELLDTWSISYVYGGSNLGDPKNCEACNSCLDEHRSAPKQRLIDCPVCSSCSLDCSHYTYEVFKQSGHESNYLTTELMNRLTPQELAKGYNFIDIGSAVNRAMPGDLLVYDGHVVLLEKKFENGRGDIIHTTSGKELRGPGNGIQRERRADLANFRGPILRILRHIDLAKELREYYLQKKSSSANAGKPYATHE